MKFKLTIKDRLNIIGLINQPGVNLSMLDMIVCTELTTMLQVKSEEITTLDIKQEGNRLTWNEVEDRKNPLEVGLNEAQVAYLKEIKLQRDEEGRYLIQAPAEQKSI